jgi:hypothetical protein
MGGRARRPDDAAEREWLREMREAGATWWMEWIPPRDADQMRDAVRRGPIRA